MPVTGLAIMVVDTTPAGLRRARAFGIIPFVARGAGVKQSADYHTLQKLMKGPPGAPGDSDSDSDDSGFGFGMLEGAPPELVVLKRRFAAPSDAMPTFVQAVGPRFKIPGPEQVRLGEAVATMQQNRQPHVYLAGRSVAGCRCAQLGRDLVEPPARSLTPRPWLL
jgi:hypothetical protein